MTATRQLLIASVGCAAERFVELVRGANPQVAVPGLQWNIQQTVAHVATVIPRYSKLPAGTQEVADTPAALPRLNNKELSEVATQELNELADRLMQEVADVVTQIERYEDDQPIYPFHGGGLVAADVALGLLLGELVVHGWDVARALKVTWPIDPADVELVWTGVEPILAGWVHPEHASGHTATYRIRLRGAGDHFLRFVDGRLVPPDDECTRIDCRISGNAAAILLILYRRRSPWRAALTGSVIALGRRPWLAFSLARRFYLP